MKVEYILDISVKYDLRLLLTWLSVPCLTTHISTLYAHVRLFGHIIEKDTIRNQVGCGGRLGFHWYFYAALERFFRYGPVGKKKRKREDKSSKYPRNTKEFEDWGMLIDTLVLDFQSAELELSFPPEDVTYRQWSDRHWGLDQEDRSEASETLSSYKTRPEWLCEYLMAWISGLLSMSYHTSQFGQPLYEHIGTIRMLVDGQLNHEFDLAARYTESSLNIEPWNVWRVSSEPGAIDTRGTGNHVARGTRGLREHSITPLAVSSSIGSSKRATHLDNWLVIVFYSHIVQIENRFGAKPT
ncbi:hypothetical protein ACN42_g11111 [Penicillium freii]|uniref:Uncharacterized protein n=1 Tax=Penicillium freii TaxID=48697 RepID=A0A101M945_PENFR|nr:hypothetical protein ACN42_g11111 [Penicillium freii]